MGAVVSGLQFLGGAGEDRETSRGTEGPEDHAGARPGHHVPEWRTQSYAGRAGAAELSHGLEGVLSSRGHAGHLRRRGSMAPPSIAHAHRQTE